MLEYQQLSNLFLSPKDPNKFLGTKMLFFCLIGYFKIKEVSLDVQELISSPKFWYLDRFYDLRRDLGVFDVSNES